jgi:large subunit ribosomal protein L15
VLGLKLTDQKNHLFINIPMNLSNLRPAKGSVRERKRVGRGQGSGMGGTSTRGHKGAQSRSGYSRKVHFEGGQMPLQRRVPKFGFKNINRVEYKPLNLDAIQTLVDETKATIVDMEFLLQHGLVSKKDLVKVLSRGELTTAVEIHAHAFSASAKEAIEKAGGKAIVPTREAKEEAAN